MKTYDNAGRLLSEITEAVRSGFGVIRTQTTYGPNERVISQTVTTREFSGTVRTFEILNGKVLP
jgi:hypothetical protein